MKRLLQGIGVTLLAICIGFGIYQNIKSDIAFNKTHYSASMTCWNCSTRIYFHVEKGTKAAGIEHVCKHCGMMVMISEG